MRVALTGGIACGKSLVAKFLNELGVATIDADDIVHELIPADERRRLAKVVFTDPKARAELEAKIHPLVKERINNRIIELSNNRNKKTSSPSSPSSSSHSIIRQFDYPIISPISIIPLLFEAHWEENFDIICCVRSAQAKQVARMMETRGYTRAEAEARLKAQLPVEVKAAKSHYVIENDGSAEELRSKVAEFVNWLKEKGM